MYSQFTIANQLPNIDHALNYQKCLLVGNYLMLLSFFIILTAISITFIFDENFTIATQISAHIATIVFAALLKIGYVLRCVALHGFGKKDF
ncbi:MAG: hypothetical protein ACPG46_00760 [Thalassotalea sp.]